MTPATMSDDKPQSVYATPTKESPLLFEGLTWREFKAVEQLLDRPGYRLSFLAAVLEIRRMPDVKMNAFFGKRAHLDYVMRCHGSSGVGTGKVS